MPVFQLSNYQMSPKTQIKWKWGRDKWYAVSLGSYNLGGKGPKFKF